ALVAAYISVYAFYQYMIARFARGLGYTAVYRFNEVALPWDPKLWDRQRVTEVNLYPLLICLFIGLLLFIFMKKQEEHWGRFQLWGFWVMVCLVNVFMAQLLYAPFGVDDPSSVFYYGLARVAVWLFIPFALQLIFG